MKTLQKETELTISKRLCTYFLGQHLLSRFIMYRRIPWRKA